jgi:hypothetical protein
MQPGRQVRRKAQGPPRGGGERGKEEHFVDVCESFTTRLAAEKTCEV